MSVHNLISRLHAEASLLMQRTWLAPCVMGQPIRVGTGGFMYAVRAEPFYRQGWGWFRMKDHRTAVWQRNALPYEVADYLADLPALTVHLAVQTGSRTWQAVAMHPAVQHQRCGHQRPLTIHLTESVQPFDAVHVRVDGHVCWFEAADRRANPMLAGNLRRLLTSRTAPLALRAKGLTPELRTAYAMAFAHQDTAMAKSDAQRLQEALAFAGGRLVSCEAANQPHLLNVRWETAAGEVHRSVIDRRDLTIHFAGICLDEEDEKFDLQSLVGVVEQRPEWAD